MTTANLSCWTEDYTLTDEHASCSYGQPVLVDRAGNVYGPSEIVFWRDDAGQPIASLRAVDVAKNLRPIHPIFGPDLTPDVEAMLRKFEKLAEAVG